MKRTIDLFIYIGVVVFVATLITGCGGGGGASSSIAPPTVTGFTATPKNLEFTGGKVVLTVQVASKSEITSVTANVYAFYAGGTVVTLTKKSGYTYSGSFDAPPNTNSDGSATNYLAILTATDANGNSTTTEPIVVAVTPPDAPPDGVPE